MTAGLDPDDLAVFVEVARTGSFRRAAEVLYVSQPSVSRAVARLERDLGVSLLHRSPRGAVVTARGAVLLEGARRLGAAMADLRRDVVDGGPVSLRLGSTATSARVILAPHLAQWIPAHPDVAVVPVEGSETDLIRGLHTGECDAAIVSGPVESASLTALRITAVRVLALFPPGHALDASPDAVTVDELAAYPLLVNGDEFPSTRLLHRELARLGHEPRIAYRSSAGHTLAAMATSGLGVAVFGGAPDLDTAGLRRRPVAVADGSVLSYDLFIAWSRSSDRPLLREFAVDLATSFAGDPL